MKNEYCDNRLYCINLKQKKSDLHLNLRKQKL